MQDGVELAVQEIPAHLAEAERAGGISEQSLALQLRRWSPAAWALAEQKDEAVLLRDSSLFDLKKTIAQLSGIEDPKFVQVAKAPSTQAQNEMTDRANSSGSGSGSSAEPTPEEVAEEAAQRERDLMVVACLNWEVPDYHLLGHSPWYLMDGQVLYYRDCREKDLHELDPVLKAAHSSQGGDGQGITITTEYD
jgi:hypothetical protein